MGLKIQRIIFGILTIATFVTIFIFSSQNGNLSGTTSRGFTRKIVEILQIDRNLSESEKENLIESCQYIIRKTAHFSIYAIAGINMYGFINTYNIKKKNKILVTLLVGIIYAISDEIHQMFSGDRTPAIRDVVIDSCGVLFGICMFLAINKIIKIRKNKALKHKGDLENIQVT